MVSSTFFSIYSSKNAVFVHGLKAKMWMRRKDLSLHLQMGLELLAQLSPYVFFEIIPMSPFSLHGAHGAKAASSNLKIRCMSSF